MKKIIINKNNLKEEDITEDVKKIADIIIKNNNLDGVAVFLQKFFANKL